MVLSDFLSRQKVDESNPCEIIPILFNMTDVLQERYYNLNSVGTSEKYLVQTRSQAKSSGVRLPEVHGIGKRSDPHVKPEKQKPMTSSTDMRPSVYKPRIGQGRAGVKKREEQYHSHSQNKLQPHQQDQYWCNILYSILLESPSQWNT